MKKKLNYDFFQVIMPQDVKINFGSILSQINSKKGNERLDSTGEYHIRLHTLTTSAADLLGDIARIRMLDIPPKMKYSGETNELGLDDDEGLGEITSFIYHPATAILLMMRNRNAVSMVGLSRYIENLSGVQGIKYKYVARPEVYKRIQQLVVIKKFDLALSAPGNAKIFDDLGISAGDMVDLMGSSPHVRLTLSCSTAYDRKLSLPKAVVEKVAVKLQKRKYSNDEAISLVISGNEENVLQKEVIDLFEDILTDFCYIDLKSERIISESKRHQAIRAIWMKNKDNLMKIFAQPLENENK